VAGGDQFGGERGIRPLATVELYDPVSGDWTSARPMAHARSGLTITLLADGRVLAIGGRAERVASAEIYEPAEDTWTEVSAPQPP